MTPAFAPDRVDFYLADPHAAFRRLRAEDPVHWYAEGPFWCATRHADVLEISRRPRSFSSAHGTQLFEVPLRLAGRRLPSEGAPSIIRMDPPEHNRHRKLAIGAFTPRMVAALEPRVRELARETTAALRPGEPFDFVERVAVPLPDAGDRRAARRPRLGPRGLPTLVRRDDRGRGERTTAETLATAGELFAYFTAKAAERRRAPREDVLSKLALAQIDGAGLSDPELAVFCLTLLVAGNETTRNLISGGMQALLEHRVQWEKLCADPGLVPGAVEEMLRWVTPVRSFVRRVQHGAELGGKSLRAGEYVALFYGSANRDEAVFGADADAFDVARPRADRHVAFGFGEHLCLGAALARLEARVMFEELVALGPGFSLAGPVVPLPSILMNGSVEMPVVFEG